MISEWIKNNGLGSFREALLVAYCKADGENQGKLATAFPATATDYLNFLNGRPAR